MPVVYEITWPNRLTSRVEVGHGGRGQAVVKITGSHEKLASLLDYHEVRTVETEIDYIARKHGAKIVRIESA